MNHNLDYLQLPEDTTSFIDRLTLDLIRKAKRNFEFHVKENLIKNLQSLGYEFKNDAEFNSFCIERIHRCLFDDRPGDNELYIDFVDSENKGTLVLYFSDKINVEYSNENKLNVTIG